MTPTQAESIARERLPCSLHEHCSSLKDKHFVDCPAHYRPAVARALVEAATLDREALIETLSDLCDYRYKPRPKTRLCERVICLCEKQADAILSSNKTRVEGEG